MTRRLKFLKGRPRGRVKALVSLTDRIGEVKVGALLPRAKTLFMALVGAAGAVACLLSARGFRWHHLDWSFATVALVTVGLGARAIVKIPRVKGEVTATDTFIFL